MRAIISLLECLLDEAKDNLVACAPEALPQAQGYARALQDVHRSITRPDPKADKETTSV